MPLKSWLQQLGGGGGQLKVSTRFQICELMLSMGKSERQFYEEFDDFDRAQILATQRTKINMALVQEKFPIPKGKGKR